MRNSRVRLRASQIHWQNDDQTKELNFFSISSDGRVASWVMSKNELKMEPIMQLKLVNTLKVTVSNCRGYLVRSFMYVIRRFAPASRQDPCDTPNIGFPVLGA